MSEGNKLEAQGHLEKALAAYVVERHWDGAVRLAMSLNRHLDAARYCLEAQRPWDAAVCFQRGGAQKECLAALLQVTPTSARYRDACVHAVRVAQTLGTPLESMSSYFMPFISYAPSTLGEAEAMKNLADAFAKSDRLRLALSIYRSVLQAFPRDHEARERMEALSTTPPPAPVRASSASGNYPVYNPTPTPMASTLSGVMRAHRPKLSELLVARGLVVQTQLEKLLREQPEVGSTEAMLTEALVAAGLVKDEDVIRVLSESCGIGWISDDDLLATATPEAAKVLTLEACEKWKVAPIKLVDRQLHVAMPDPRDMAFVDQLRFSAGMKIVGVFATPTGIRRTVGKLFHGEDPDRSDVSSWHGQLLDPTGGALALEPFSDRYTGTREHQFDTGEFEQPGGLAAAQKKEKRKHSTIDIPDAPRVGARFADRYQLEALIGEGGSASVFRAMDMELNEPVAIKLFSPATSSEADTMVARFKLELSLSRILAHPNIIRLFDLGSQGQWRYLTMELLHGKDLSTLMEERGALPIVEGLKYLEQVCQGLQLAHQRGVVHRDIKPHNLFVCSSGEVKVMDFGIARKINAPGVTVVGTIAGTPEYMSPEQINGFSDVTHSTDLYALGITAYQMFTGELPFSQPELTRLLVAQATEPPPPPRKKNPAIPADLEMVLLKLLEKKAEDRLASAAELGSALRGIRASLEQKN